MNKVYLSLGSNIGDKINYLKKAVNLLMKYKEINITKCSSYYETAPVDYIEQDNFINQVIELNTSFKPYELLKVCQSIEKSLGRKRTIRFGPRTIDIDILLYNNLLLNDEKLIIPHPRMLERAFVLIPLYEINKNLVIKNKDLKILVDDIKKRDYYIRKI